MSDLVCCSEMKQNLLSKEVPVIYLSKFREYGISVLDGGSSFIEIKCCPWCGSTLPTSLRTQWFEKIASLGLEPDSSKIPLEYLDDKWWVTN